MIFELKTETKTIRYDTIAHSFDAQLPNDLVDEVVSSIDNKRECGDFTNKKDKVTNLKLLLGLKCNYSCRYCSQCFDRGISNNKQPKSTTIDSVLVSTFNQYKNIKNIELWGGEPLVYFKTLKYVVEKLRNDIGYRENIHFISNGSLLTDSITDFLIKNNIIVTISHDGVSQKINRNKDDILDDESIVNNIKRLHENGCFASMHIVVTNENVNFFDNSLFFDKKLFDGAPISIEGLVCLSKENIDKIDTFTTESQGTLIECFNMVGRDENLRHRVGGVYTKIAKFIKTLNNPNHKLPKYSCNDSSDSVLSIDLNGNVLTCHTVEHIPELNIGNVLDDNVSFENRNKGFITWDKRNTDCKNCVAFNVCRGGCGVIDNDDHKTYHCMNKWLDGVATISGAIGLLFGERLLSITRVENE